MRMYRKVALGKPLPILDLNVALSAIMACLVFIVLLDLSLTNLFAQDRFVLEKNLRRVHIFECLNKAPELAADPKAVETGINSETGSIDWDYGETDSYEEFMQRQLQRRDFQICMGNKAGREEYYYVSQSMFASLRKQAIQSFNPNSIPSQYRNDYVATINDLKQASLLYIGLETLQGVLQPLSGLLAYLGVGWLTIVLLGNWSLTLDRRFTYNCRQRRYVRSTGLLVLAMAIWLLPLILLNTIIARGILDVVRHGSWLGIREGLVLRRASSPSRLL